MKGYLDISTCDIQYACIDRLESLISCHCGTFQKECLLEITLIEVLYGHSWSPEVVAYWLVIPWLFLKCHHEINILGIFCDMHSTTTTKNWMFLGTNITVDFTCFLCLVLSGSVGCCYSSWPCSRDVVWSVPGGWKRQAWRMRAIMYYINRKCRGSRKTVISDVYNTHPHAAILVLWSGATLQAHMVRGTFWVSGKN